MTEYALVGPEDEILRYAHNIDPDVETKKGFRWLPVKQVDIALDTQTEIAIEPEIKVQRSNVIRRIQKRAKTEDEIDRDSERTLPLMKILHSMENRIRVLEGKDPITIAECRAQMKDPLRA